MSRNKYARLGVRWNNLTAKERKKYADRAPVNMTGFNYFLIVEGKKS